MTICTSTIVNTDRSRRPIRRSPDGGETPREAGPHKKARRPKPMPLNVCDQCQGPLIEIDRYGERLIGCVACNRWGWPGDKNLIMELPEEDIAALRQRATPSQQQ
jgi:hypothetical protein